MKSIHAVILGVVIGGGLFYWLFDQSMKNERLFFYTIASWIIGAKPQAGDGAFHVPLAWLLMLALSIAMGVLSTCLLKRFVIFHK